MPCCRPNEWTVSDGMFDAQAALSLGAPRQGFLRTKVFSFGRE